MCLSAYGSATVLVLINFSVLFWLRCRLPLLFSIGNVAGVLAPIVFSLPPLIRLTVHRSVHLYVTEEGRRYLVKAPQPTQGKLSIALVQLSPSQLSKLENILEVLVQVLHVKDDQAGLVPILSE